MNDLLWPTTWAWVAAYVTTLLGSGPVVRALLARAGKSVPQDEVNPGRVIGKLENVLVVSLVAVDALTARALVFAAKGIARVEGGRENASYYILGTLANFTWSLVVALAARWTIRVVAFLG